MEESLGGYVEGDLGDLAEVVGDEEEPVHDLEAVMELVEGPDPEGEEAVRVDATIAGDDDDGVITDKVKIGGREDDQDEGQTVVGGEAVISHAGTDLEDVIGEEEAPSPFPFQNIPCLACGSNCFIKSESAQAPPEGPLYSGAELLLKFCQFLKIRKVGFWDGEEDGAMVPICNGCKNQLALLLDLERKLKELENDFRNGVREFRSMCEGAEGLFQSSGIYEKDVRYFKVRKQVVRRTGMARPSLPRRKVAAEVVPKTEVDPPKRSARVRKSIRTKSISALSHYSPVVAVSEYDRAKADQFQLVKSEVISDAELDFNHDDGFQLNSPMDTGGGGYDMIGNEEDPSNSRTSSISKPQPDTDPFQPSTGNATSMKRKRQRPPPPPPNKPKLKRGRKPKSSKKALTANGRRVGRGRPRKDPPPEALRQSKKTDKARQIVTITDESILNAFIYADSEEEGEKEKGKSAKGAKKIKKKEDVEYQLDDKDPEESDDDFDFDENERTQHDPTTGEFIFLHVTFTPLFDGTDKFKCSECGLQTAKSSLRKHTFKYHTTRFKCKECGHCEGSPAHLRNHIRYKHLEKKPANVCPICGKPCSSMKSRFLNHMTTHYSEQEKAEALARGEKLKMWKDRRNIQCDHCGKKFTSKKELERHNLSKHPKPEEAGMMLMYKELCPDCGKLVDRHYINLHRMRSHNITLDANLTVGTALEQEGPEANKRFICTICDKRFFKSKELVRHKMGVHDRNYPFKCELCPRAFLLQRQLDRHKNTHSNIRPFPCSHCPMAFFTNGNRTRHISIYHAEGANPRRKAYVRGSTSFTAKRFQIKSQETDPPPQSGDVFIVAEGGAPPSITESSESNRQQIKDEETPRTSGSGGGGGSMQVHGHHSSKPPGNEAELLESIMQFQTAMSQTGGGGSTTVPATVIQSAASSASIMQEFLFRHQQQHQSN